MMVYYNLNLFLVLIPFKLYSSSDPIMRRKYVSLVESVREKGAEVLIFSSMHESGQRELISSDSSFHKNFMFSSCFDYRFFPYLRIEPINWNRGYLNFPSRCWGGRSRRTRGERRTEVRGIIRESLMDLLINDWLSQKEKNISYFLQSSRRMLLLCTK